jgi:hypothetical protein
MISKTYFRDILTVVGLAIVLTIFLTRSGFSQDTTKMKGDKKVRIVAKIIEDKNGKREEFDTTINLDRRLKPGEAEDMMKDFKMRMKDLDDHNFNPREFNFDYNFDFPERGEIPQRLLREFGNENDRSLNDVLGDIPMDQVKSYSIQDTKDGKRIVIELNKEPLTRHHKEVIILRSPRPENTYKRDYDKPQMKKKVIINNGDEDEEENEN